MKMNLILIVLLGLFFSSPFAQAQANDTCKSPRLQVKVTPAPVDTSPENWKAEIVVGTLKSYADLAKIRRDAYSKRRERDVESYKIKARKMTEIYARYLKEEYAALQILKTKDSAGAIYWLEKKSGYEFTGQLSDKEPVSDAYADFKAIMLDIEKRRAPENTQVQADYEFRMKRAEAIYQEETAAAEKLYEENRTK